MPAMAQSQLLAKAPSQALFAALASTQLDIIASQRLRYQVFAEEMGPVAAFSARARAGILTPAAARRAPPGPRS
jgi:hypothetical protein